MSRTSEFAESRTRVRGWVCMMFGMTLSLSTGWLNSALAADVELRWSSGAQDVAFSEARRCTLVIEAEPGHNLPAGWQLQWIADTDSLRTPLVFVPEPAWGGACDILPPTDPATAAARSVTAYYCDADVEAATSARLIVDAPARALANLQVVAFLPAPGDSMTGTVVQSNVITMNGGCSGGFQPVVFRARSTHRLGELTVEMAGVNLDRVNEVPIAALDSSWTYALPVVAKSGQALMARATIAAPLPAIVVGAADEGGGVGAATVKADSFPPFEPQICASFFEGSSDTTLLLPKDFAMISTGDAWHVFYTRQYSPMIYTDGANTRRLGHAKSTAEDLDTWSVENRSVVQVRPGRIWDNRHVWAPSIVRKGITYYMFYTGVQLDTLQPSPTITTEIQRIGIATSVDLDTWTQDAEPVYFNNKVPWTFQDSTSHGVNGFDGWQFRDPFVMEDPEFPGEWLMYYVTIDSALAQHVVGVARTSGGDLRKWQDVWPIRRTSSAFMNAARDESPHVFKFHGKWWLLYASNHGNQDEITYVWNHQSPADSAGWTQPDSLKAITCGQHPFMVTMTLWHGTEYLRLNDDHQYLGAFTDNLPDGGNLAFTQIQLPDGSCPTDTLRLACPNVASVEEHGAGNAVARPLTLAVASGLPARTGVVLRLALRDPSRVHVAIYDVGGRRLKTLINEVRTAGDATFLWDGTADTGRPLSSGVYFVRAISRSGQAVLSLPFVR